MITDKAASKGRKPAEPPRPSNTRFRVGFFLMLALLVLVGGRVIVVQGCDPEGLASAATARRTTSTILSSARGEILDTNGVVLAQTIV